MNLRVATPSDNQQLAALSNLTPMDGTISVCIKREPDFFSLLYRLGEPHVIVAEENTIIIGCVSIVKEEMMLMNKPTIFYYLCDLKVHPEHRNKKVGTHLSKAMHAWLLQQDADLLFSTVANENQKVMPLFNGKAGIENVTTAGKFYILQLVPKKNYKVNHAYTILRCSAEEKIVQMHSQFAERYVLHPYANAEYYNDCIHFAALKNGNLVAAISLFDPVSLKQNVLISIPWYYSLAVNFLRLAKPVLHTPYMPHNGEAIRILYVKDFSYLPGNEDALISLIKFASEYAYKNNYSFLSITFHEKDELRPRLRKFRSFPFIAYGMICSLKNNMEIISKVKEGNVFKDFSLV